MEILRRSTYTTTAFHSPATLWLTNGLHFLSLKHCPHFHPWTTGWKARWGLQKLWLSINSSPVKRVQVASRGIPRENLSDSQKPLGQSNYGRYDNLSTPQIHESVLSLTTPK